ncbi:MAG: FAD binding domain-containing protein, partial [Chloroflexi bacterium]|nr:FAD binding domain-containing protein [Chloroflexota bacterium]
MHPFTYLAPKSLDEALQVLAKDNGEVRPLVGGTDLIDQMRQNRLTPSVVLDVKRIPETMRLEYIAGEGLHIGSAVPCTDTAAYAQVE